MGVSADRTLTTAVYTYAVIKGAHAGRGDRQRTVCEICDCVKDGIHLRGSTTSKRHCVRVLAVAPAEATNPGRSEIFKTI